jgi:hypothetical protein
VAAKRKHVQGAFQNQPIQNRPAQIESTIDSDVAIQIDDFLGIVNLDDVGKTWNPSSLH